MAIKNKEGYHKMLNGKMMKDSEMKYKIKKTLKIKKK